MSVGSDQGPQGADGLSGDSGERGPKVNYSKLQQLCTVNVL